MQGGVVLDWRWWLLLGEAVYLVVWAKYCLDKYKEYKA